MRKATLLALAISGLCFDACAAQPFLRTDGPSVAGGIAVAPIDQRCGRRYDNPVSDVLDLTVAVQVTNSTDVPATVDPGNVRLTVDGDVTPPQSRQLPIEIPPGSSKAISLKFLRYGDAKCNEPMTLSLEHGVRLGSRELQMQPVSFVPSGSDT
jgi:hypothetical protein